MMTMVFTGCDLLGGDKNEEAAQEGANSNSSTEQNQGNSGFLRPCI